MLYLRLLLIVAVVAAIVWFLRRLYLAAARNPRLRYTLANVGSQLFRLIVLRYLFGTLFRAVRFLRFFR